MLFASHLLKIFVLAWLLVASLVTGAKATEPGNADRPNIVLLLADDLGWRGVGCFGSEFYETPNIDKLATQGTSFTEAFSAASTCAPSRASIMTGLYTPAHKMLYVGPGKYQTRWKEKHGNLKRFKMIQPAGETALPPGVQTLAENLKAAGYRTGMFGKWHLGRKKNGPGSRGFDVYIQSHGKHFGFETDPPMDHPPEQYLSDFLSDHAVAFIKESVAQKKPFFLYYPDFLVHKPWEAKKEYLDYFSKKQKGEHQKSPVAAAMIKSLDDSIGKIVAALDEAGVADNTIIIFTSDNGGLAYEEDGFKEENTSNFPLRGRKGSEYDGGLRIPWIVRWPGHTPAGVKCDTPIHHIDLFPTLSAIGGGTAPPQKLHGVDLTRLFQHPEKGLPERSLYWYLPGYSSFHIPSVMVRRGDWKLIRRLEDETAYLYNTQKDIGETIEFGDANPELKSELSAATMKWLQDLDAPMMVPNPDYDPAADRSRKRKRNR